MLLDYSTGMFVLDCDESISKMPLSLVNGVTTEELPRTSVTKKREDSTYSLLDDDVSLQNYVLIA